MFMSGVVGLLMREFALTLSAAVVLSVGLSLTFTPMLCGKFLKAPEPPRNPVMKGLEAGFHALERGYGRWLDVVMRHKLVTMAVFISTAILAVVLYVTAHTGFFPQQDSGFIQANISLPQGSGFPLAESKILQVAHIMTRDPEVAETDFSIGGNLSQA